MAKKAVQVVLDERLIEAADAEVSRNPALSTRSQLIANLLAPFLPENIHIRIDRRDGSKPARQAQH